MNALIIMTFLSGASWGPQVQVAPFPTLQMCETALNAAVVDMVEGSKSNTTAGELIVTREGRRMVLSTPVGRQVARLSCPNEKDSQSEKDKIHQLLKKSGE